MSETINASGERTTRVKDAGFMWQEGDTQALTTGNNDGEITLAQGANQRVGRVRVSAPGVGDPLTVIFYNGDGGTGTAISGTLQLHAQPSQGFNLGMHTLTTGKLGWRIAGLSSGTSTAYFTIEYDY